MSEIQTKVTSIIVDKLGVSENEVTLDAAFTEHLGADSLDTVELIMELEKSNLENILKWQQIQKKKLVITYYGVGEGVWHSDSR